VLDVVDLSKRFGGVRALDGCSLSVERGRMLGFLGPNGAGKTTLMRTVFGLVDADGGTVLWDGRRIGAEERLRFGYMPEERGLYPRMRLGEQLEYVGRLHGLSARAARVATARWLERLGIADRAAATVEQLSHGNQQRAQLAAALVHDPELLVLDEPFAGLDPVAVRTLADILRGEAARGAAVLFSSHQLELVEEICEEIAIIHRGRILEAGDLAALRRASPLRRIRLQLSGAPPAWVPEVPGVELLERRNGDLTLRAARDVDPDCVLEDAQRSAEVVAFSYGPPTLAEHFVELVER
jgi:ABC-2 type transport system ATP-binding protein